MKIEHDIKKDGTWDVFFSSESEALLDCDVKLGTGYGDETNDFVKAKETRRYEIRLIFKDGDRMDLISYVEPKLSNGFVLYRKPEDDAFAGLSLSDVTKFWVTAYDVPILRKRVTGVDPIWNPGNDKKQIHYIYKYGEKVVHRSWHF